MNNFFALILLLFPLNIIECGENANKTNEEVISTNLNEWLAKDHNKREPLESLDFANKPLTKSQADDAAKLIYKDKQERLLSIYDSQWENRILEFDNLKMPFYYSIFGDKPSDGRSLFISLHGGGATTVAQNNQQYNNQKHLYDIAMKNIEAVYLAPRAPTNTWNLWHESHIDDFINIIIQMAVVELDVNPNKVYLLGSSAGGDGVYQLTPRMADRFAAASMMTGHPNNASPLGLRNTPFAIHVGELDDAYDRNLVAKQWGEQLDSLQLDDSEGYIHDIHIHKNTGHGLYLKDSIALPWMKQYIRNPIPQKIVWKQGNVHHNSFYWLGIPEKQNENSKIVVAYNKTLNEINIIENSCDSIQLLLNDEMLNLDNPVSIKYQGKEIDKKTFKRSILNIYKNIDLKGDINLSFPCIISIKNNNEIIE